ncbi:MAG: hypothetical protein Q4G69_01670 [Planctomycetia bacterium]|nr:hypothetical protein [Planctomycetia bacterium]
MIKDCPDRRVLQQWARDCPNGSNPAVFAHLCHCKKCREQWQEEIRCLIYDEFASEYAATAEEIIMVKTFLMKKQDEEKRWVLLTNKIAQLYKLEQIDLSLWSESYVGIFFSQIAASGDNIYRRLYSSDKAEVVIVFSAVCPKEDPHYWKAELTFPPVVAPETVLSLFIEDGRELPVPAGKFVLFDQELAIEDGIAKITFEEYLRNLKNHSVKLIYPDKTEFSGTLKYF